MCRCSKSELGTKPSGALIEGRIQLFTENLKSAGDAYVTVFREVFHLGMQKAIPAEDYAALFRRYANNPLVARYVQQWKKFAKGVERTAKMTVQQFI